MSKDPEEPEYRVYRGGDGSTHASRRKRPAKPAGDGGGPVPPPSRPVPPPSRPVPPPSRPAAPPSRPAASRRPASRAPGAPVDPEDDYRVYRSQPRGLGARLRGETESDLGRRAEAAEIAGATRSEARRARASGHGGRGSRPDGRRGRLGRWGRHTWTPWRALKYVVSLLVAWVLLSLVLFVISAETKAGSLPKGLAASLTKDSSPMLLSAQNVLVLGLDNRPTTGRGSKEGGLTAAQTIEADARTDSIMIWRVGGGVSRRLSIPRDTFVNLPQIGESKINAAWGELGPGYTVRAVEALTGIKINHVIVVDLANFPKFIDDVGGVTVKTGRICSSISGGAKDGGFSLYLKPGSHHLNGLEALTLARTRDNSCNVAYTDIQREEAQQEILNSIKSQLFSFHAFTHLPWVSWDAPGVIQTDMGAATLLQLFASSEIGGNAKPQTLTETGEVVGGQDVLVPNPANVRAKAYQLLHG
jgi:LCP family protein required for cell wall assembly